jgi:hypothetical protein
MKTEHRVVTAVDELTGPGFLENNLSVLSMSACWHVDVIKSYVTHLSPLRDSELSFCGLFNDAV